jgi:cell wall-associated NlpC family hydrolase
VLNPRIDMHITSTRFVAMAILIGLVFSSCTSRKETANRYKYLIKDNNSTVASTETNDATDAAPIKAKVLGPRLSEKLEPVLNEAKDYLGTPYRYGGSDKRGVDCSGLTQLAYEKAGISLPRSAAEQSQYGEKVDRKSLEIGDLVFFDAKGKGKIDHVGMIVKVDGDQAVFIHSSTSKGVRYDELNQGYWADKLVDARRPLD